MPVLLVRRDRHAMVFQRADETPVAEVERARTVKFGKDDVDHLVEALALAIEHGGPNEARRHRRIADCRAILRQPRLEQQAIRRRSLRSDRARGAEVEQDEATGLTLERLIGKIGIGLHHPEFE